MELFFWQACKSAIDSVFPLRIKHCKETNLTDVGNKSNEVSKWCWRSVVFLKIEYFYLFIWATLKRIHLFIVVCTKIQILPTLAFAGLEHVVEMRFGRREEPHYECKLCGFNTEMAPMIEHLSGYKHRRAYIVSNFDVFWSQFLYGNPFCFRL